MKTNVCVSVASDKPFSMVLSTLLTTKNFVSYAYELPLAPICEKFPRLKGCRVDHAFIDLILSVICTNKQTL